MAEKEIYFNELPIQIKKTEKRVKRIYFVAEGDDSQVNDVFLQLDKKKQLQFKKLLTKIATIKDFKADSITWNFKKYKYGELKPKPQRYFFFQDMGDAIILFAAIYNKDQDSLGDKYYKALDDERRRYSNEFRKKNK